MTPYNEADPGTREHTEVSVSDGRRTVERQRRREGQGSETVEWIETKVSGSEADPAERTYTPDAFLEAVRSGRAAPFRPLALSKKSRLIARIVGVLARSVPDVDPGATDVDANIALVARYVEEFKNEQKFQVFPKLFAANFQHHFDFDGQPTTAASFINVGVNLLDAFPDVHVEILDLFGEGDLVVEHNSVTASHRGTWMGIAPTGRSVRWNEVHIYRISQGRIVENWPHVDFDGLTLQVS